VNPFPTPFEKNIIGTEPIGEYPPDVSVDPSRPTHHKIGSKFTRPSIAEVCIHWKTWGVVAVNAPSANRGIETGGLLPPATELAPLLPVYPPTAFEMSLIGIHFPVNESESHRTNAAAPLSSAS
jgi:hypothetical protein